MLATHSSVCQVDLVEFAEFWGGEVIPQLEEMKKEAKASAGGEVLKKWYDGSPASPSKRLRVMPCELIVHAALVESSELLELNSVSNSVCGLDLTPLNGLSHRTRAIRLNEFNHRILTEPRAVMRLRLDDDEPPELSGSTDIELDAVIDGEVHLIVYWFTAKLERMDRFGAAEISTAPGAGGTMRGHAWGRKSWIGASNPYHTLIHQSVGYTVPAT